MQPSLLQRSPEGLFTPRSARSLRLVLKRLFDILFATLALLGGLPLLVLLGLLVWLTDPGPILYSQIRMGRYGRPFRIWKLRSMTVDAEEQLQELLGSDASLREEWASSQKLQRDPRITPLGAWLRRTSLDELPQFWNVLIGDLSLVGPRPLTRLEIETHLQEAALEILSMRPGLTCTWQLSGRSHLTYAQRVALDLEYVRTWTFPGDLRMIFQTVTQMLRPCGAY